MSELSDIKRRKNGINAIKKVTNAMKLVASANLNKFKTYNEYRQYFLNACKANLSIILYTYSKNNKEINQYPFIFRAEQDLDTNPNENSEVMIIFSSDKGLCGGFNNNLFKLASQQINKVKNIKLILIGKKAIKFFSKDYKANIYKTYNLEKNDFTNISSIISQDLLSLNPNQISLAYNKFRNIISQTPTIIYACHFINNETLTNDKTLALNENYEVEGHLALEQALSLYLSTLIFSTIIENKIGEESARMTFMDNSTKNANKIIDSLSLEYNRKRQAVITKELIEIISGAETLKDQ